MNYWSPLRVAFCAGVFAFVAVGCGQEEAPAPAPDLSATPAPAECTVAETTYEDLIARIDSLAGTPRAGLVAATPDLGDALPRTGPRPADPTTIAAVTAAMSEAVACTNDTNHLAFLALVTDQLLIETIARAGIPTDPAAASATPATIPPEQHASLLAVRNVQVLPDGRVTALVELFRPAQGSEIQVNLVVFLQQAGRWRIDLLVSNLQDEFAPISEMPVSAAAGTPVP